LLKMAVVVEVEMMMISSSKKCETSVAWCRLDTTMMPLFFFYAGYIGLRVILAPFSPSSSSVVVVGGVCTLEFPRTYISYIISKVSHVSTLDLMDFDR